MYVAIDRHEDMEKFPLKGTSSSASTAAAVHSTVATSYNSVDAQVGAAQIYEV